MATSSKEEGGELLFFGCTDWAKIGRDSKKAEDKEQRQQMYPNLPGPHRLKSLMGVQITQVAAGCASCHCIAIDSSGKVYTWGRNENGQLGHGDLLQRNIPTVVADLPKNIKAVKAAAGRHHSVVVFSDGSSFAFGANKHGQLGSGSLKQDMHMKPVKCLVTNATDVACGAEFTVWLSSNTGATILSAGLPQYGQLGHGTDHEYNAKASSVQLCYEGQPTPRSLAALAGKKIARVACGNNHSVAVDSDGFVYTWGFGGHGRLGHKVQKDEFVPKQVAEFQRYNIATPTGVVACGAGFSSCTGGGGELYMWGKVKTTGENVMYPKPFRDLSGWNIRSLDSGNTTSAAAADDSVITWGQAQYGELGYGPDGPKSSAAAKKVDVLSGMHALKVACGMGHTMVIMDRTVKPEKLEELPVHNAQEENQEGTGENSSEDEEEEEEEEEAVPAGSKRKAAAGKKAPAPKKPPAAKGGRGGAAAAKAATDGKKKGAAAAPKPAGRGAGRGAARGGAGAGRGKAAAGGRGRGK